MIVFVGFCDFVWDLTAEGVYLSVYDFALRISGFVVNLRVSLTWWLVD